ncbi:MAG: PilN domain-containing protein [Desulfuromonadales bacterium]|nr:PilN domain-containing protein [Desulfuromonadales bacterium]
MRFTINLATKTYLDHQLINRGLIISLLVLVMLSAWKVVSFCGNMGKQERLRADIASLEERLKSRSAGVSEQEYSSQQKTIRFYNEIIERKSANWLSLLEQLERATPEGIALASLAPEKKTGILKIEGRARNFGQVRTYLERLGDSKAFTDILLLSHADQVVGEKGHGVRFTISCRTVKQ